MIVKIVNKGRVSWRHGKHGGGLRGIALERDREAKRRREQRQQQEEPMYASVPEAFQAERNRRGRGRRRR